VLKSSGVNADITHNPLDPIDTSSPRSTLAGFYKTMGEGYSNVWGPKGFVPTYLNSGRLFPENEDMLTAIDTIRNDRIKTAKFLDLSAVPRAVLSQSAWRLTIQLKEVLDRLDLPPLDQVPDAVMMKASGQKRWIVPGSEIAIALIEVGPRAGEYLFTQDTVAQITSFYDRIKTLPYKPGASEAMYDHVFYEPSGVALAFFRIIPPRWFYGFPSWTKRLVLDQPIWRWFAILLAGSLLFGGLWLCIAMAFRYQGPHSERLKFWNLLPASFMLIMSPTVDFFMGEVIRVSPSLFQWQPLLLWGLFYLSLTWFVWVLGRITAEWVIGIERLQSNSTDSQLIRLFLRLFTTVISFAILMEGANRLGLPSYSIMAGLGIGGLAAALAGQQALANLLGSLIIMFEKPFRIGQTIKTGSIEGRVEEVGFRSTRIRTTEHTLMSIPSSGLINNPIENLSTRKFWRIKRLFYLATKTPVTHIRSFQHDVRTLLEAHPSLKPKTVRVVVSDITGHGYELLIDFCMTEADESIRLQLCDALFLNIADFASKHAISFEQNRM